VDDELSLDEDEDGVDEDDAGGLANAVPAIRAAAARAGIRYLNFIAVVSEMKEDLVSALRAARVPDRLMCILGIWLSDSDAHQPGRLPGSQSARIMPGILSDKRHMTAT
jgi:hypothetical protein